MSGQLVDDVTTHPAFHPTARSFAMIYDRKRAAENRDVMTCEENGEPSRLFPAAAIARRPRAAARDHRRIASWTARSSTAVTIFRAM
jgi:4-hydroxyphenylacetate 3-monooxygenase